MNPMIRIVGAIAAGALGGVAVYFAEKKLRNGKPFFVKKTEFAEQAETDAEAAAEVEAAYAEAAAEDNAEESAAEEAPAEEPDSAEPEEPVAPAAEPAPAVQPEYDPDGPNPNPVEAGPAAAPTDENGKIDVTKIAEPGDFANWDELGCQS